MIFVITFKMPKKRHILLSQMQWFVFIAVCLSTSFSVPAYEFAVPKPEFGEDPEDLNVTSFTGHTSRLPCTVRHLAGKQVSWIRGRDLTVLSSGRITFATDVRITVLPGAHAISTSERKRPRAKRKSNRAENSWSSTGINNELTNDLKDQYSNPTWASKSDNDRVSKRSSALKGFNQNDHYVGRNKYGFYSDFGYQKYQPTSSRDDIIERNYQSNSRNIAGERHLPNLDKSGFIQGETYSKSNYDDYMAQKQYETDWNDGKKQQRNTKRAQHDAENKHSPSQIKVSSLYESNHNKNDFNARSRKYNYSVKYKDDGNHSSASSLSSASSVLPSNYLEGVWEPEDFTLQIKYTEPGDAGTYICQVNTEPKTAQRIHLTVTDMVAKIVGPKELFVKAGTQVTLVCQVDSSAALPGFIYWYKRDQLVDYEASNGRIEVVTHAEGQSDLILRQATQEDSANYTCGPSGGQSASVILNVIVDERPAAMQQGNKSDSTSDDKSLLLFLLLILFMTHVSFSGFGQSCQGRENEDDFDEKVMTIEAVSGPENSNALLDNLLPDYFNSEAINFFTLGKKFEGQNLLVRTDRVKYPNFSENFSNVFSSRSVIFEDRRKFEKRKLFESGSFLTSNLRSKELSYFEPIFGRWERTART